MKLSITILISLFIIAAPASIWSQSDGFDNDNPIVIKHHNFGDIKRQLDSAKENSVFQFETKKEVVFRKTIVIDKKIKIRGLWAKQKDPDDIECPEEGEKFNLLVITADGVVIENFKLRGYYKAKNEATAERKRKCIEKKENAYERDKHALIWVAANNCTIQNGKVRNSLKDGVKVTPDPEIAKNINGGTIKNISGWDNHKDVVSIGGNGADGIVKNVNVEIIKCWNSSDKGAVEVSDGTYKITVKKVDAYQSKYAVDIQDHKKEKQDNRKITIEEVRATECEYAIITSNKDLKHSDLSIQKVIAIRCGIPILIKNTKGVTLKEVCIEDGKPIEDVPFKLKSSESRIQLSNCSGKVVLEGVNIQDPEKIFKNTSALKINNCTKSNSLRKTKIRATTCPFTILFP